MPICDECGHRRPENLGRYFQRESGRIGGAVNGSYSWGGKSKSSRKRMGYSGGRTLYKQYFVCFDCKPLPTREQIAAQKKQEAINRYYTKWFLTICFFIGQAVWGAQDTASWTVSWKENWWIHLLVLAFVIPLSNPVKKAKEQAKIERLAIASRETQERWVRVVATNAEEDGLEQKKSLAPILTSESNDEQSLYDESSADYDPLYDEAVAIVLKSRRASISSLHRQMRIGYNRAARLIEDMERAGLVSPMQSNGNRDVLG